jgi:hypothetical protein
MADLKRGWAVVGNDGQHVGTVRDVGQNYVHVSTTAMSRGLYIPASAIANVQSEVVHLNVTHRVVGQMDWEQPPRDADAPDAAAEDDLHRHI